MSEASPVVGVLGGGQLGRMLALAAAPLDVQVRLLDRKAGACGGRVAPLTVADFGDSEAVRAFASGCDVVTLEFESVSLAACEAAGEVAALRPGIGSQRTAQDRSRERGLFSELGIETPRWAHAGSASELESLASGFELPALVKRCRGGYDGKGQAWLERAADAQRVFEELGGEGVEAGGGVILDEPVAFEREVSMVVVRGGDGDMRFYPLAENLHEGGILRRTIAPAPGATPDVEEQARGAARAVAERLGHVGVLAVEFFQRGDRLLANEIAPRVHNTGHWTIEGAATSQFENHLRAVLGWPLGVSEARGTWAMVNLIGAGPDRAAVLGLEGAHLHLYGKSARAGRKVGHVTVPVSGPMKGPVGEAAGAGGPGAGAGADPLLGAVERLARGEG